MTVTPGAFQLDTVNNCIRRTEFWAGLNILYFRVKMRLASDQSNRLYAWWVRDFSYAPTLRDLVTLPSEIKHHYNQEEAFYQHVFPLAQVQDTNHSDNYFLERGILASHHSSVNTANDAILNMMPGPVIDLHSADSAIETGQFGVSELTVKYLASLCPP